MPRINLMELAEQSFGTSLEQLDDRRIYKLLVKLVQERSATCPLNNGKKKLYYISAEFLIGKLLINNMIDLGIYDEVKDQLTAAGHDLNKIEEFEVEPSLGNGGLGRLAACFLDSIATLGLTGDGVGLNYHYGLFRQRFVDNQQKAVPDEWLGEQDILVDDDRSYTVEFGDFAVTSKLVNIDVPGYGQPTKNRLRLFDLTSVDDGLVPGSSIDFDKTEIAKNLTLFLYPDDSDEQGRLLRIYQEYFMVSNAAQLLIDEAIERGSNLHDLADYAVVQINDTHPTMVIPELIRLLTTEHGIEFDEAVTIVRSMVAYTNHTILAEALEKWPLASLRKVSPAIADIIVKLDEVAKAEHDDPRVAIIDEHDTVHMAHMDIHFGFSINGVAALHTKILEDTELHPFYEIYPEKFSNKTNGITFRRWIHGANPALASLLDDVIGTDWRSTGDLSKLAKFADDKDVLERLAATKVEAKAIMRQFMALEQGVTIPSNAIIDVQVKRIHEYKRQQMLALYIIWKYLDIKNGNRPKHPVTIIFGGKAAPAYTIAQDIIHLILTLSQWIANDPDVAPYLQVVMIENYNVTAAERVIPAADISEQISLAGTEASGTSNMKLMMNGALTLGTLDGSNVEISELVGPENIKIFGMKTEEVEELQASGRYYAWDRYNADRGRLGRIVDQLTDGTLAGLSGNFESVRDHLMVENDPYLVMGDFHAYAQAWEELTSGYSDRRAWNKSALHNTAKAGFFSSDRTIAEYEADIWHIEA
mgnify:FL=1